MVPVFIPTEENVEKGAYLNSLRNDVVQLLSDQFDADLVSEDDVTVMLLELTMSIRKRELKLAFRRCESCGEPARHTDPDGGHFCMPCVDASGGPDAFSGGDTK